MFDQRAFRSWVHILLGAVLFSGAFLIVMVVAQSVVGTDAVYRRATTAISVAAFIGYVVTAWLVRESPLED